VAAIFTIENSQQIEEIRIELANRGYDAIRIQEGADLHIDFASAIQAQIIARQEQYTKTMRALTAYNVAFNVYQGLVNLLRITFENERDIMQELGLFGKRERSASGFITQSTFFYNTLLNKDRIYNRIAKFQITKEMLQADLELVKDFEKANREQEDAKGLFGEATDLRDKAYRKLRHWMREFEKINKIVFYDKPYLLERLRFKALTDISRKEKPSTVPPDSQQPPATAAPATQVQSNPESVTANNHES